MWLWFATVCVRKHLFYLILIYFIEIGRAVKDRVLSKSSSKELTLKERGSLLKTHFLWASPGFQPKTDFLRLNTLQTIASGCEDNAHLPYTERLVYTVRTAQHCAPLSLIPGALINPSDFWHIQSEHVRARKVLGTVGASTQLQSILGCVFRLRVELLSCS